MAELIIESVPSGAEVQMDGEVVGTTPLAITIDEISLEAFRAECLSNGEVSCSWDILHIYLIQHDVSRLWWDLTETERRSVAEMAIKNMMFYQLHQQRKGKANCAGGTEEWMPAVCVNNAIIRYLKFGNKFKYLKYDMSSCYYRHYEYSNEMCYMPEYYYDLPCFMVTSSPPGHSMSAIQVVQGIDSLDNWIVFQYGDFDIKPGNWQMPHDVEVHIRNTIHFTPCGGHGYNGNIATFKLPPEEISLEAFRAECLLDGLVSCDWDTLKIRLEDQTVSRLWWDLTETERRSVAEMAIKNTLFYDTQFKRTGKSNCEGGEGSWTRPGHVTNAIIRYQKFAQVLSGTDMCYWTRSIHEEESCFSPSVAYGLPCFMVSCTGINDPYSMCCVQVVQGTDSLDNWIVFQYPDFDMKPNDPLMPYGSTIEIQIPSSFISCAGVAWGSAIATFVLEPDELDVFREECLLDGAVVCSWDTLKTWLEDLTVSRVWWDLTETERRSIAKMATENVMRYTIRWKRKGKSDCEGGEGDWSSAVCLHNSAIRFQKFCGNRSGLDICYWKREVESDEMCYIAEYPYNLPGSMISCIGVGPAHSMCSIRVVQGIDSLDNWIIFQYGSIDIKPGDLQIPVGSTVRILTSISFSPCGSLTYWSPEAIFEV